ncbi:DUF1653 domain-containing protein [Candidatus Daviesbacteria bacterium]|nr:DUF1653 domain-containing protein [Candidatus Daviesbacteria bacterium]
MKKVKLGVYRHYKGNYYLVLGVAQHSEDLTQEFVVYKPLYKSLVVTDLCIRPKDMFLEKVQLGKKLVPRFKFQSVSSHTESP